MRDKNSFPSALLRVLRGEIFPVMGGKAFDGNRWNDCHYSNNVKREAREH